MSWHRGLHPAILQSQQDHHYQVCRAAAPQLVSLTQLAPSFAAYRHHNCLQKLGRRWAASCSHRCSDIYHSSPLQLLPSNRKEQTLCSRNLGKAVQSGMSVTRGGRKRWRNSVHQAWARAVSPWAFMPLSWKHHLRKVVHLLLTYQQRDRISLTRVQTCRWCPSLGIPTQVWSPHSAPTFD